MRRSPENQLNLSFQDPKDENKDKSEVEVLEKMVETSSGQRIKITETDKGRVFDGLAPKDEENWQREINTDRAYAYFEDAQRTLKKSQNSDERKIGDKELRKAHREAIVEDIERSLDAHAKKFGLKRNSKK